MARKESDPPVTLSVLERLIDEEPRNRSEAGLTRAQSVRELKTAVRRDLEWLLNSRRAVQQPDERAEYLPHSVYNFGLIDITSLSFDSRDDRQFLQRAIEEAISTFEPRLDRVRVVPQPVDDRRRLLRFSIEGLLRMDPSPELVSFDTYLELGSGECKVK